MDPTGWRTIETALQNNGASMAQLWFAWDQRRNGRNRADGLIRFVQGWQANAEGIVWPECYECGGTPCLCAKHLEAGGENAAIVLPTCRACQDTGWLDHKCQFACNQCGIGKALSLQRKEAKEKAVEENYKRAAERQKAAQEAAKRLQDRKAQFRSEGACPSCEGRKIREDGDCSDCQGTGLFLTREEMAKRDVCPDCYGTGKFWRNPCLSCKSTGKWSSHNSRNSYYRTLMQAVPPKRVQSPGTADEEWKGHTTGRSLPVSGSDSQCFTHA